MNSLSRPRLPADRLPGRWVGGETVRARNSLRTSSSMARVFWTWPGGGDGGSVCIVALERQLQIREGLLQAGRVAQDATTAEQCARVRFAGFGEISVARRKRTSIEQERLIRPSGTRSCSHGCPAFCTSSKGPAYSVRARWYAATASAGLPAARAWVADALGVEKVPDVDAHAVAVEQADTTFDSHDLVRLSLAQPGRTQGPGRR
jgi:hypothetical protein